MSKSDHAGPGEKPHFVADYEKFVDELVAHFPLDEAMAHAVGGNYEGTGLVEKRILEYAGLHPPMSLVDVGCGSGRLASVLAGDIDDLGTDVVERLLSYARTKSPSTFEFLRHTDLTIPRRDASIDMVCAFSVFTHLHHAESFLYMQDCLRALRPGGKLVFSFLEFADPAHWGVFDHTLGYYLAGRPPHLNTFIERQVIPTAR